MRNLPKFRPDPSDYSFLPHKLPEPEAVGLGADGSLSRLAETLSVNSEVVSTDLALDLVLNEIAEHARLSTAASGVAIVLERSGEVVCRATTGNAPGLGIRLSTTGLSALSLQSKTSEYCADSEADSRVDPEACRSLRVRSILVVPVIRKEEVVGLLEAFSGEAHHFTEQDTETLKSFCRQIVYSLDQAVEATASARSKTPPVMQKFEATEHEVDSAAIAKPKSRSTDRGTVVLTATVIGVALLLGWLLGRAERHRAETRQPQIAKRTNGQTSQQNNAGNQNPAVQNLGSQDLQNTEANNGAVLEAPKENASEKPIASDKDKAETRNGTVENPDDGLVVYQNGKVLFRENGTPRTQAQGRRIVAKGSGQKSAASVSKEMLTPDRVNDYLSYRVEPQYPESARQEHVKGPVALKVMVGKDGGVEQVQVLSGDSRLGAAAANAVVQWKFKPLLRSGQPVEFETQVTVDFKLP